MKGFVSFEKEFDIGLYLNDNGRLLISIKNGSDMIIFRFQKDYLDYSIENGWEMIKNINNDVSCKLFNGLE